MMASPGGGVNGTPTTPLAMVIRAQSSYATVIGETCLVTALRPFKTDENGTDVTIENLHNLLVVPKLEYFDFENAAVTVRDEIGRLETERKGEVAMARLTKAYNDAVETKKMAESGTPRNETSLYRETLQTIRLGGDIGKTIRQWKGDGDDRSAKEFVKDCWRHMQQDCRLDMSETENQKEFATLIKRSVAEKIRLSISEDWDHWVNEQNVRGVTDPFPKEKELTLWLEETVSVKKTVSDLITELLQLCQRAPGPAAYNSYRLEFKNIMTRLKNKDLTFDTKEISGVQNKDFLTNIIYTRGIHDSIRRTMGQYKDCTNFQNMSFEVLTDKIRERLQTRAGEFADAGKRKYGEYANKSRYSPWQRAQRVAYAEDEQEPEHEEWEEREWHEEYEDHMTAGYEEMQWEDQTVAFAKGGAIGKSGKGGGKSKGKGGKGKGGKGKSGKNDSNVEFYTRCPRCKHPGHSTPQRCFWDTDYSHDDSFPRPSWIQELLKKGYEHADYKKGLQSPIDHNKNLPAKQKYKF